MLNQNIIEEKQFCHRLFILSFIALFLELMLIRWVPSTVRMVAYFTNLMLISSFLGLGLGAILSNRNLNIFRCFPFLLAVDIAFLLLCRHLTLPTEGSEARFWSIPATFVNYLVLIGIFSINAIMFISLGEGIGKIFNSLSALRAYAWDLGGSLCGTLCFGLFSFFYFSPVLGFLVVIILIFILADKKDRSWNFVFSVLAMGLVLFFVNNKAIWSPYHYITIHQSIYKNTPLVSKPPAQLKTMKDPPIYTVRVNQDFYQFHGTIDLKRYTLNGSKYKYIEAFRQSYLLPYTIKPNPEHVAIIGSGGGLDVEAALLSGAKKVDAVEIDPVLIQISSRFSAKSVYQDPRVKVHVDDARAFFQKSNTKYDLIAFGFLDSQALFSAMSNLRLDGFVYTVESIRSAYSLLNESGMLTISFIAGKTWLASKLIGMVKKATGKEPIIYVHGVSIILCAPRGDHSPPPKRFGLYTRVYHGESNVPLATDDWPYLYLSSRTIPKHYLVVICVLFTITIFGIFIFKPKRMSVIDLHFLFLGAGFLLLQTKSIVDCSLYFGATWLVTTIVVAGVLTMVLAANYTALKMVRFSKLLYIPLFLSLLGVYFVPREMILNLDFLGRAAWTMFAVPFPIFFAGLIFSTTLRESENPSSMFGANLIGATIGGFCEYLGMVIGYSDLFLLVIVAYLLSLSCRYNIP